MRLLPLLAALVPLLMPLHAAPAQGASPGVPASSADRAARTRIAPGDRVVVKVWREPLLSDTAAFVNDREEVVLPRLGVVSVASQTPATLRDSLLARYATFLRDPVVDVMVLRRVIVNGEVGKPGVYYVDVAATLRDVIATAGGVTPNGNPRKVQVVRDGRPIPVPDWARDTSVTSDLESGDQIVVGRRSWFASNGLGLVGTLVGVASLLIALR